MSFKVDWNLLESESMTEWTKELLTETLNSGTRPNILASDIEIKDLNFGKIPPNFEILEIGELEKDRFRCIFKIDYSGDSSITLHTKVQANPLKIYNDNLVELEKTIGSSSNFISPNFLLSNNEFSLPLDLKLSDIKISGIGILVFSKTKGLTLVFRNDPLDSIKVSSTFDMVQVLANFLQKQIERQVRELFRETLPTVLHKLSLKYISSSDDNLLNIKDQFINMNSNQPEVILFDLNNEFNNYSMKNLSKNLQLFNSRETLRLNVPKFNNVIQRCNLEKINKKLSPNLLNSLNMISDSLIHDTNSNNGIPINILADNDYSKLTSVIKDISYIQSNNYYQKNNNLVKPKRRVIKLNRKRKVPSPEATVDDTADSSEMSEAMSETTLIEDEIAHPQPVRVPLKPIHSHIHFHRSLDSSSPTNSNSSLLSGVGIGNNYFNFTNPEYVTVEPNEKEAPKEPLREPHKESPKESPKTTAARDFKKEFPKDKDEIRYLYLNTIREKLNELKKLEMDNHRHFYTELPPPYQQ